MENLFQDKVIIVEGLSDRNKIKKIIKEPSKLFVQMERFQLTLLEEWVETWFDSDLYILVDADKSGERIRKTLKKEFPNALHLYIDKEFREVASAPSYHLASVLLMANIEVHSEYIR